MSAILHRYATDFYMHGLVSFDCVRWRNEAGDRYGFNRNRQSL